MAMTVRRWTQLLCALGATLVLASCGGSAAEQGSVEADNSSDATDARATAQATAVLPLAVARLTTPWTDQALSASVPLPEYPRPQMTRGEWVNLNGLWSYNGGAAAPNAQNPPASAPPFPANAERIRVPFPVESFLSGIQRGNDRNLWYRRDFTVPAGWNGRRVLLHFGAVDRLATVYVNGRRVGQHSGGYDAFSFDITPFLAAGNNQLVVGVFDSNDRSDMTGKQSLTPGGIFYTASSGIWQTVWMEPVAASHVSRLDLTPNVGNQSLSVVPNGQNLQGLTVEAIVSSGGSEVSRASGSATQALNVRVPNPRLWSPSDPFLYDLRVLVKDSGGRTVDEVGSYFGMRSIGIATVGGVPRPVLNGKFVFQHGPLDQGFWPDGLYTAPTDEALRSDLSAAKELGFNMVRKHIKVEPQRWFYWADRLGLLVWQDMPQTWDAESDPALRDRTRAQWREIVDEHRSSPAVVTWVIFNESWGDWDHPAAAALFRQWDSTRLINTHSGINFAPGDVGAGDLIDVHDYNATPSGPGFQNNRPAVIGEYGGSGLRSPGHMWNPGSTCCYALFPDSASLQAQIIGQIENLRDVVNSQGVSAAVYTEITDVEDELNGFLTYDRRVRKLDFAAVRAANEALRNGVPYLGNDRVYSLRVVTPGYTDRYLRHADSLGFTEIVNSGSAPLLKQDASWRVVPGLSNGACVSFEAINVPGRFLRESGLRMRIDGNDGSDAFRRSATFCTRPALGGGAGASFESADRPGFFIRHAGGQVVLNANDGSDLFKQDATWAPRLGWWQSGVILRTGEFQSLRVLTPGFDNRYLRHQLGLAFTEVVTPASPQVLKDDATWRIVPGLSEPSCYSFESRNFPNEYLRHEASRVRRQPFDTNDQYRRDATFCAFPGAGGGVRFAAINFPKRFLRHYGGEVWIADGANGDAWNTQASFAQDSRWAIEGPR